MAYVNPIEILQLQSEQIGAIDNAVLKKAKRRLFADIELSDDGHLEYKGNKLTRSDCEKAIDQLEHKNISEFYNHLAHNKPLNEFLANGNQGILNSFHAESIYNLPEFIDFVSPHFSIQLEKVLLKSFQSGNIDILSKAFRTEKLLNQSDLNRAFKGVSAELNGRISEVDIITRDIKNEESDYTTESIFELVGIIEEQFPVELLNVLPKYFQSQINKIAASINFLQLAIWNEFNNATVPLNLLEQLLQLDIESAGKPTYEKNYAIIKKKHLDRIEKEKNAPLLKNWAGILLSIQGKLKNVDDESLSSKVAYESIKESFLIDDLNKLPSYADEIRTQIGYSIRSMAISCWNFQSDLNSAVSLIDLALQIDLDAETKKAFQQDKTELEQLEIKYRGVLTCHFCEDGQPEEDCEYSTTIYRETSRSYNSVQFTYSEINIPRCGKCNQIHSKGQATYYLVFAACVVGGVLIGSLVGGHYIIGGIVGLVGGAIAAYVAQQGQSKKEGIKDTSDRTLRTHPILEVRLSAGWTLTKPSA